MTAAAPTNSAIITDYKARTPASGALFERARKVLPSGITHDARYLDSYSIHVRRAKGPRKWDVDGNEYVDYFGGHGAMLLGHSHPAIIEAVKQQMDLGTHYGSSPELEVRWAELVCEPIPSAQQVPFTPSGTEAPHLAHRLARAPTGTDHIVRVLLAFRWSSGGAQKALAVTPDLCILAKIVAGGVPGGAVAGKREILDQIDHAASAAKKRDKTAHPGPYNANPLSAAAAVTALTLVRDEDLAEKANRTAAELRDALRQVLVEESMPWGIYGQSSTFLIYPNPTCEPLHPPPFHPQNPGSPNLQAALSGPPTTHT